MIKITGILYIRSITGRNGAFSVGRLVTEIGEFSIKDSLLDQYEEGRYEGEFGIGRIYPFSYLAGNRMVIEVRATLETMALAAIGELPADHEDSIPEPDPIEAELPPPPAIPIEGPASPAPPSTADEEQPTEPDTASEDALLFGTLWPLGETVKLDTTIDRARFRKQKDRLKALGYRFQPLGQIWRLP